MRIDIETRLAHTNLPHRYMRFMADALPSRTDSESERQRPATNKENLVYSRAKRNDPRVIIVECSPAVVLPISYQTVHI